MVLKNIVPSFLNKWDCKGGTSLLQSYFAAMQIGSTLVLLGFFIMKLLKVDDSCRFTHLVFKVPGFRYGKPVSAVYKIVFDEKYFYIGSSNNIKKRFKNWEYTILKGGTHNSNMEKILPFITEIKFEIINEASTGWKQIEDVLLKENFENPFCLNHSPSAFNLIGSQRIKGGKIKKDRKRTINPLNYMPVVKLTKDGALIKKYSTALEAIKEGFQVLQVLEGKTITTRGCIFRLIDTNGCIVHFERKPRYKVALKPFIKQSAWADKINIAHNENYKGIKGKKCPLIAINKNGEIEKFESIVEAAKKLNIYPINIRKVLVGKWRYHHGYVFKYA